MQQFPTPDLTLYFQGVAVIVTALLSVWAVRKIIKLVNKS